MTKVFDTDSKSTSEFAKAPEEGSLVWCLQYDVQPGTYEVVSSYQGAAQTVKAKAGGRYAVSFGIIGCPG